VTFSKIRPGEGRISWGLNITKVQHVKLLLCLAMFYTEPM